MARSAAVRLSLFSSRFFFARSSSLSYQLPNSSTGNGGLILARRGGGACEATVSDSIDSRENLVSTDAGIVR